MSSYEMSYELGLQVQPILSYSSITVWHILTKALCKDKAIVKAVVFTELSGFDQNTGETRVCESEGGDAEHSDPHTYWSLQEGAL